MKYSNNKIELEAFYALQDALEQERVSLMVQIMETMDDKITLEMYFLLKLSSIKEK